AFALSKSAEGPVALAEDASRLLENPALVETALAAACTPENQAVPLDAVKRKLVRPLQAGFAERLRDQLSSGRLSPGVGCLPIKKKPHLFLFAAVGVPQGSAARVDPLREPDHAAPAPAPVDVAGLIEEAFATLDRSSGGHNLVSLVALRAALPV